MCIYIDRERKGFLFIQWFRCIMSTRIMDIVMSRLQILRRQQFFWKLKLFVNWFKVYCVFSNHDSFHLKLFHLLAFFFQQLLYNVFLLIALKHWVFLEVINFGLF